MCRSLLVPECIVLTSYLLSPPVQAVCRPQSHVVHHQANIFQAGFQRCNAIVGDVIVLAGKSGGSMRKTCGTFSIPKIFDPMDDFALTLSGIDER